MTREIRSRLAGLKLPQHTLASMLGVSQTKLNLILNGHRPPPAGFEAKAVAALDTLERAEQAGPRGQSVLLRSTVDEQAFCTAHRSQTVYHGPVNLRWSLRASATWTGSRGRRFGGPLRALTSRRSRSG